MAKTKLRTVLLMEEGLTSGDGRYFTPGAGKWRQTPLTTLLLDYNNGHKGHKGSVAAGSLVAIWRDGNKLYGSLRLGSTPAGELAETYISEGTILSLSIDMVGVEVDPFTIDAPGPTVFTSYTIAGMTLCPIQAMSTSRVLDQVGVVIDVDAIPQMPHPFAITASGVNIAEAAIASVKAKPELQPGQRPSLSYYLDPKLDGATPATIIGSHYFGHLALWNTCHTGYKNECVTPPEVSPTGYGRFLLGGTLTAENVVVPTGIVTAGTTHAPLNMSMREATNHYDHSGYAAADVRVGHDSHGIWFSGTVRAEATPEQKLNLMRHPLSGDWRDEGQGLDLIRGLACNSPGYVVKRSALALVASSAPMYNGKSTMLSSYTYTTYVHGSEMSEAADLSQNTSDFELGISDYVGADCRVFSGRAAKTPRGISLILPGMAKEFPRQANVLIIVTDPADEAAMPAEDFVPALEYNNTPGTAQSGYLSANSVELSADTTSITKDTEMSKACSCTVSTEAAAGVETPAVEAPAAPVEAAAEQHAACGCASRLAELADDGDEDDKGGDSDPQHSGSADEAAHAADCACPICNNAKDAAAQAAAEAAAAEAEATAIEASARAASALIKFNALERGYAALAFGEANIAISAEVSEAGVASLQTAVTELAGRIVGSRVSWTASDLSAQLDELELALLTIGSATLL